MVGSVPGWRHGLVLLGVLARHFPGISATGAGETVTQALPSQGGPTRRHRFRTGRAAVVSPVCFLSAGGRRFQRVSPELPDCGWFVTWSPATSAIPIAPLPPTLTSDRTMGDSRGINRRDTRQ